MYRRSSVLFKSIRSFSTSNVNLLGGYGSGTRIRAMNRQPESLNKEEMLRPSENALLSESNQYGIDNAMGGDLKGKPKVNPAYEKEPYIGGDARTSKGGAGMLEHQMGNFHKTTDPTAPAAKQSTHDWRGQPHNPTKKMKGSSKSRSDGPLPGDSQFVNNNTVEAESGDITSTPYLKDPSKRLLMNDKME